MTAPTQLDLFEAIYLARSVPCACGFDVGSVWPRFSADWHRSHRSHRSRHLAAFPDLDQVSRNNLDLFVEWAEQKEAAS